MSYESSTVRVPPPNLQGYAYLYSLESGLRELIIECLEPLGSKAYKQRLPGDVLDKYRKGREFELSIKWKSLIPHHPLYYVDFTDLRKIILRDDNWKELFKPIFSNKDLLRAKMSEELDLVRNKIAHNRKISKSDLILIELTYSHIVDLVGKDRFEALATKCTDAPDLRERLIRLREFAEVSLERCWLVKPISDMTVWESTVGEWWFDDSF